VHNHTFSTGRSKIQRLVFCASFAAVALAPYTAAAESPTPTNWVDWNLPTTYDIGTVGGYGNYSLGAGGLGVTGTATIPGSSTVVTVTHTGETHEASSSSTTDWIVSYPPLPGPCCSAFAANNI